MNAGEICWIYELFENIKIFHFEKEIEIFASGDLNGPHQHC